jgi:hypothetical protein
MKKSTLASMALVFAIATGNADAENGMTTGKLGLNIGFAQPTAVGSGTPTDFMINGKYFISKDTAVLAGIGLVVVDSGVSPNSKSTNLGFQGGIRKYFKTDDFAPFAGGMMQYLSTRSGTGGAARDVTDFALMAVGGAEYFLGKQFSLEGSVGFGYSSSESQSVSTGASTKASAFGTVMFNVSTNFYF